MELKVWFALALVIFLMLLPWLRLKIYRSVTFIEPLDLYNALRNNNDEQVLIDIRNAKAFTHKAIADSINVASSPFNVRINDIETIISSNPQKAHTIIALSDIDAAKTCSALLKRGITNVQALRGGFSFWARKRLPLDPARVPDTK